MNSSSFDSAARRALVERAESIQIEYFDQGAGPVIVILPSLGRSGRDFDDVAACLAAQGFRVVRPEPRGIGRSRGEMGNLTLHDFAADVAAVLDQEQVGPAVVVGHAWGSQPARMLAADRPDLVRAVVLAAASAGKVPPGSGEKPYGRLRAVIDGAGDENLPEDQRLACLRQAFFAPGNDPTSWLDGWYREAHDAQAHARDITPIDEYFSAGDRVPILDLQGRYDAVVIPNVMKQFLGERVTVVVLDGAAHAMAPEQPAAMCVAIADFVRSLDRKESGPA